MFISIFEKLKLGKMYLKIPLFWCVITLFWRNAGGVINKDQQSISKYYFRDINIQKVSLTQKGYIQFLRYINEVPPLTEYTFCIWLRSENFNHSHPLLSYSKHEEERLIRVWIAPLGSSINLEIMGSHIFKLPIQFAERHWYHICQSWSSSHATWNVYLNGKLRSSGNEPKLRGLKIPGGGDIVIGQEYTDFDKGLDDGIEGDIFGFNFVLSSTSGSKYYPVRRLSYFEPSEVRTTYSYEVPSALSYFTIKPNRQSKTFRELFGSMMSYFEEQPQRVRIETKQAQFGSRVINDIEEFGSSKPLGLKLVELGFNCALGKGSPVYGKDVLISWTRSPVRVFGGAILKHVPPFCV